MTTQEIYTAALRIIEAAMIQEVNSIRGCEDYNGTLADRAFNATKWIKDNGMAGDFRIWLNNWTKKRFTGLADFQMIDDVKINLFGNGLVYEMGI